MKTIFKSIILFSMIALFISCEKDEGKLPKISFKTGSGYISGSSSVAPNSTIKIGIDAEKSEKKDVLNRFNISKSVNGVGNYSVVEKTLSGGDGDKYSYDFTEVMDTTHGQTNKYTFTVTNRDGLTNQLDLTVTIQ